MIKYILSFIILISLFDCLTAQNDIEIKLARFESSECQDDLNVYHKNNRIVSIENSGDTTIIEITVKEDCCISMIPDIKVYSDTIDLIYDKYEDEYYIKDGDTIMIERTACDCICCFSFKYYLLGLTDKEYLYNAENEIIQLSPHEYKVVQEEKFQIIDGDTVNRVDIYGFRQGVYKKYDEQNREIMSLVYLDNNPDSGLMRRDFSDDGMIKQELYWIEYGNYKVLIYDKKGKVIKECFSSSPVDYEEKNCIDLN